MSRSGAPSHGANGVKVWMKRIGTASRSAQQVFYCDKLGSEREIWLPMSQVNMVAHHPEKPYVYVTLWLAQKEGFPI
jgi:hypothetical protein